MKAAGKSGARFTVILGEREAEHGAVGVKDMTTSEQLEVPRQLVAGWVQERIETSLPHETDAER